MIYIFKDLEEELNRYKRAVLGGQTSAGNAGNVNSIGETNTVSRGYHSSSSSGGGGGVMPHSSLNSSTLPNGAGTMTSMSAGCGHTSISTMGANSLGGGITGTGISSSISSHALQSMNTAGHLYGGSGQTTVEKLLMSGSSGLAGISPLPVNIHTMKSMPPSALSQVKYF